MDASFRSVTFNAAREFRFIGTRASGETCCMSSDARHLCPSCQAARREEAEMFDAASIAAVRRYFGGLSLPACFSLARAGERDQRGDGPYGLTTRRMPVDISGSPEPPASYDIALRRRREGRR